MNKIKMDKGDENPLGLSTNEALERLYSDIDIVLEQYKKSHKIKKTKSYIYDAFHHNSVNSTLCWTSICGIVVCAICLLIAFAGHREVASSSLVYEAFFLLCVCGLCAFLALSDNKLRHNEIPRRVQIILDEIKRAAANEKWIPDNYPHLCSPYSPCITLQWTYRDGVLVNLPWALLVKDDVVVIRPGQVSPGYCGALEKNCEYPILHPKEVYGPSLKNANESISVPKVRKPLENKKYRIVETPYISNLKMALDQALDKPATQLEQRRHLVMVRCFEQIALPMLLLLVLLVNALRYLYLSSFIGSASFLEMFILVPISVILPLLPIIFPAIWMILNQIGNARLRAIFDYSFAIASENDPFDDADLSTLNRFLPQYTWRDIWNNFVLIFCGTGHIMTRSANILHVFGSLTALCCVDKKGILSWPNPTAEKVFFLHNTEDDSQSSSLENVGDINTDTDSLEHRTISASGAAVTHNKYNDSSPMSVAEVLDLTHDHKDPFKLHFDDQEWNKHMTSLKPLGLAILLNTCNLETQEHYLKFCSHVTCEAMYNEHLVPVTNRRCLCELAKQIGFSEQAQKIFKLEQQLATFRHLQPEMVRRDNKFARSLQLSTKLKFPFPHMMAVVIKELSSGAHQLLSQGTADMVLDSCVDFWDGRDLCVLTASDRKKIQDFYQRTSLTSYCTAFSYRPLSGNVSEKLSQVYLELPSDSKQLFKTRRSPMPFHWDNKVVIEPRFKGPLAQFFSTDSLLYNNDSASTETSNPDNCFDVQCNQVFIGMVTMQYQAQADMVHLIEQLERACIRFVHFSKENELRSRVFSEKMGLESGWNCHISLLSERTRRESGPTECWANNGTARIYSPASLPRRKLISSPTFSSTSIAIHTSNLEQSRAISFSAPSAINLEHATVKFDPSVEQPTSYDSGEGYDLVTSEDSMLMQGGGTRTEAGSSPTHEHWQSLSCLTDSTEQSAPVNFDMSNRAKLPRGIDKIRPHIEQIDNVPLLVSLFTDCTATVIREMLQIMQDFGEVVCVMLSSANADNMGICMQADTSIAVEPLYPQVCQKLPAFNTCKTSPSPIELSRALNSVSCPLSVRREDPFSIYHLVMYARHYTQTLWSCTQFWLCCCATLTLLQVLALLFMLPPILRTSHVLWLCFVIIPALSVSLMAIPSDPTIMKAPLGKNQSVLNVEIFMFVLWCYGAKFLPAVFTVLIIYSASLTSFCYDICVVSNCTCAMYFLPDLNHQTSWGGWSYHSYTLLSAQQLALLLIVIHFITISMSFINRQKSIWEQGPQNNLLWICTVVILLTLHAIYAALSLLLEYKNSQLGFEGLSYVVFIFACVSPLISFAVTEFIKTKEIKVNVRYQRRARLDFGTKLGMNSPF